MSTKQSCVKKVEHGRLAPPGTPVRVPNASHGTSDESESGSKLSGTKKSTPVKSNNAYSRKTSQCAVCLEEVVDGRDEAIFCEGQCKMWFHRWCARVSQELLSTLTASEEPFCLMCSRASFQQQVTELASVFESLKV